VKLDSFIVAADNQEQIHQWYDQGYRQFVIGLKEFSRLGEWESDQIEPLFKKYSLATFHFEWDTLAHEDKLNKQLDLFFKLWSTLPWGSIRCLDTGVVHALRESTFPITALLEAGFHNQEAMFEFTSREKKITTVQLSRELPKNQCVLYSNVLASLNLSVELPLFTALLLFYSPRSLLTPIVGLGKESIQTIASSEESPHKGFILRENRHGTFMFHPKFYSLLTQMSELMNLSVTWFIDLRPVAFSECRDFSAQLAQWLATSRAESELDILMESFPHESMRGFHHINKSDIIFTKLKNHHRAHDQYRYVGEVMDFSSSKGLLVQLSGGVQLKLGQKLWLQSPQGAQLEIELSRLTNLNQQSCHDSGNDTLIFINYVKQIPSKSAVFLIQEA
jgi:putative protease